MNLTSSQKFDGINLKHVYFEFKEVFEGLRSLGAPLRLVDKDINYFSSFFEVDRLYDLNPTTVIKKLKMHMALFGIPDQVI